MGVVEEMVGVHMSVVMIPCWVFVTEQGGEACGGGEPPPPLSLFIWFTFGGDENLGLKLFDELEDGKAVCRCLAAWAGRTPVNYPEVDGRTLGMDTRPSQVQLCSFWLVPNHGIGDGMMAFRLSVKRETKIKNPIGLVFPPKSLPLCC